MVDKTLESLGSIPESKGCGDGGLRNILLGHRYLMIGTNEVYFGEDTFAVQEIGKIMDVQNRVAVRDGSIVEKSIVTARSSISSGGSGDKVKRGSPRTVRRMDDVETQHMIEFEFDSLELFRR